jgi:AraC-like DNA-binding protein
MQAATHNFAPVRYSYEDLPERDRAAVWWEIVGRKVLGVECQPLAEGPFHAEITHRALPGLGLVNVKSSGQRFELVTGKDYFMLSITGSGAVVATQCGREVQSGAGDATLMSYAESLTYLRPLAGTSRSLVIPSATLAPLVSNIEDAVVRPIPRHTEGLRLLTGYLDLLEADDLLASAETRQLIVSHVHDLVALTVGATKDAAAFAESRGLRAARLHAIKTDIIENVGRTDLTIDALARRHRLHPRYIQRLFEATGTTFSEFVVSQRLTRAHRMLLDVRHRDKNISAIAFACGFGDLSYFNRCFRRRFGTSPSALRAEAQRDDNR